MDKSSENSISWPSVGDRVKHLKRGSVYEVIETIDLHPDVVLRDEQILRESDQILLISGKMLVISHNTTVGVQITGEMKTSGSWVIYRPDHQEDGLPDLWMRHASEFEGRFVPA